MPLVLTPEEQSRVKTYSILRTERELGVDRIARIVDDALAALVHTALHDLGPGVDITVRDLRPSDLPGYTNEEWVETSGTDNTYATTTGGDDTAIADETFLAIWGCRFLSAASHVTGATISLLRISVGASIKAAWQVAHLFTLINSGTAAGETPGGGGVPLAAYTDSPFIVRQNQNVKIEEYVNVATTAYRVVFLGATAEKVGKTLSP